METTPPDIRSEAAAAAPDLSRPAPPTAAASVATGDVHGDSSASSNIIMSDEMMAAIENAHIVRGRPRHPHSQGVIERVNAAYKAGLQKLDAREEQ